MHSVVNGLFGNINAANPCISPFVLIAESIERLCFTRRTLLPMMYHILDLVFKNVNQNISGNLKLPNSENKQVLK